MLYIGASISLLFIIVAAYWLLKKNNSQAVLLITGVSMLALSILLGTTELKLNGESTGWVVFDLFRSIKETFSTNILRVGLMIMTIGGYVAYMKSIKASDALVYVAMKPLHMLRKFPYLAASMVIPIGQMLFVCTPSATGLGLLLVASVYPILINLGVSRITAVSVISACTVFDMGPGSANTARASELSGMNNMQYFIEHQLPLAIPLTITMMIVYYFNNRYFDKKDAALNGAQQEAQQGEQKDFKVDIPLIYAILPVLPLALLVVFSKYFQFFGRPIELDTTSAMFVALFVTLVFEFVRLRSFREAFKQLKSFWDGMGKVFGNVVTLIVAAEIFSKGLISLGFIDVLVEGCTSLGFEGVLISIVIIFVIFMAAIMMGSGNASFFSFGPLIPDIAAKVGMKPVDMILPMQLSSSMGRAISPIAGVIIAISEVAGVETTKLAKRNAIPLGITLIVMIVIHYLIY